jgi:HSP20 family molecular chaperone IbpA
MKETTVPEKRESQVPETREEERSQAPAVDIFEMPDALVVVADLPGVDKADIQVHVENDVLTLGGKAQSAAPGDSVYREYQLMNYYRQFQINEQIDQDKIRAEMRNGVLTIQLPKAERAKPRKISVNVAS